MQLIHVSYPESAWFMLQRLREACGGPSGNRGKLSGLVEVDECFIGGKEGNKHEHKKLDGPWKRR
jgi:hypothetical protein